MDAINGPNDPCQRGIKLSDCRVYLVSPDEQQWRFKKERSMAFLSHKGLNPIHVKSPLMKYGGAGGFIMAINEELEKQKDVSNKDFHPFIVFEDDIDEHYWRPEIMIPQSADCVWLGISCWENPHVRRINTEVSQIFNMYSNHGMMFCTRDFAVQFRQRALFALNNKLPYDLPTRILQQQFEVYALNKPLVYQNDPNFQDNIPVTKVTLDQSPQLSDEIYQLWKARRMIFESQWI
jgi:hypothetical protein